MILKDCLKGSWNPKLLIDGIRYDRDFRALHPEYFDPDGICIFTGMQGSGKTLSAVNYVWKLTQLYPDVMIVSNMQLFIPDYGWDIIKYEGYQQIKDLDNGYAGIILLLDEIQSEFNSLESAKIDPAWFQVISMQRKRRLHVVGTSQLFSRVAKPWREQFHNAIECSHIGKLQINRNIDCLHAHEKDGELVYETSDLYVWWRDSRLYEMYDTWERVKKVEGAKIECK